MRYDVFVNDRAVKVRYRDRGGQFVESAHHRTAMGQFTHQQGTPVHINKVDSRWHGEVGHVHNKPLTPDKHYVRTPHGLIVGPYRHHELVATGQPAHEHRSRL